MNKLELLKQELWTKELLLDRHETSPTSHTPFLCYTKEGYKVMVRMNSLRKNIFPKPFYKTNPHTIWNIKNIWLPTYAPNYELLSGCFIDAYAPLTWRHRERKDLPSFQLNWSQFQVRKSHPLVNLEIKSERYRKSAVKVKDEIVECLSSREHYLKWRLAEGEELRYKNGNTPLKFIHADGYVTQTTLSSLKRGSKLQKFWKGRVELSTFNMIVWLKENTPYELKEGEKYKGNEELHTFICKKHGEFQKTWDKMLQKTQCYDCYLESLRGKNNSNWNFSLTKEERIKNRDYYEYKKWSYAVYERDNYTCQCCERRGSQDIVAHHKDGYHWCSERRVDISNGVTLCENCHKHFHKTYGNRNNTESQFEEWMQNMTNLKKDCMESFYNEINKFLVKNKKVDKRRTQEIQSGIKNIVWSKEKKKWHVKISRKHIGYFIELDKAIYAKESYLKSLGEVQ